MFEQWKRRAALRAELKKLAGDTSGGELVHPEINNGRAVWKIDVPGQSPVYMQQAQGGADRDLYVVPVNANAFYKLWLADGFGKPDSDQCVLRSEMKQDRKFKWAADGFAQGKSNPVPLARASFAHQEGQPVASLSDGMTRTFWLLAHNVPAFPVLVAGHDAAHGLNTAAGVRPGIIRLSDLFDQKSKNLPEQSNKKQITQHQKKEIAKVKTAINKKSKGIDFE